MNKRILSMTVILLLLSTTWLTSAQDEEPIEPPHWEYEGEAGPEHWGDLETYELCSTGRAQSPIDVTGAASLNLSDIAFGYTPVTTPIVNNGHTIQVNYPTDGTANTIVYNETTYDLFQFHFHHPSEHTIDGQAASLEIHFVHRARNAAGEKDPTGAIAVVGVMLVEGEADNAAYASIFGNLPTEKTEPDAISPQIEVLTADLLPETQTFYTYSGSLTTPPCSQGVRWLLLTEPVALSAAQIETFSAIFELNARPVQPLNERDLLADSESDS
jgi:carbonic anhydrase